MNVLIIDDDFLFGNLLMHQIMVTSDGAMSVSLVTEFENLKYEINKTDLVLLDKNLDECPMSSQEVINLVKSQSKNVNVVIMSGSEDGAIDDYPFLLKNEFLAEILISKFC